MKVSTILALSLSPLAVGALALPGCSTAPPSQEAKDVLTTNSKAALDAMVKDDAGMQDLIDKSEAYAIFPGVGKGGVGVGGAYGRGEVYQKGQLIGYAELSQASIGFQLGGQTFTELLIFQTPEALEQFKGNKFSFAANASAVAVKSGAAAAAKFENGVAAFTRPEAGAMFEASVGGQQFTYQALGAPAK